MNPSWIRGRLNVLTKIAEERQRCCDGVFAATIGGAAIDFMTPEERRERHELILLQPTAAEEREAARLRIQARVAERRGANAVLRG